MFVRRSLLACCVLAVPYTACLAQASYTADQYFDSRWYITPFGTFVKPDSNRRADDGWGGGLAIGKPVSPNWNIELRGQYENLDGEFNLPNRYKNGSLSLDAQWFFMGRQGIRLWQSNSIQPYLVGGIGAINDKYETPTSSQNKTSFMANAGGGIVWPFSSWGRLVVDARYRYDDNKDSIVGARGHFDDWLFSLGLQIPFGPAPQVAQVAATPPPPVMPPPPPPPPPTRNFQVSSDGTFAFDKAVLTPTGRSRVDSALQELKSSNFRVRSVNIVGYTDPLGSTEYNQRLSVARANAVRDHMVNQGVPANTIQTEGRGESDLKITEADCRAQGAKTRKALIACLEPDRRVEIRATGEQAP